LFEEFAGYEAVMIVRVVNDAEGGVLGLTIGGGALCMSWRGAANPQLSCFPWISSTLFMPQASIYGIRAAKDLIHSL
jgi:hypothetical protein